MPANADETGSKLMSLLDMFGRELLRSKINESMRLRQEAKEANEAARGLSSGKGKNCREFTKTWFNSPTEAQTTLRELKQLSPRLFANATVVGHYLVHPKDKDGSRAIEKAIDRVSRDHRFVTYFSFDGDLKEKAKTAKPYLDSKPDGNCTRFTFGDPNDQGACFNAAYYCSVLQDYDINARHIGNQVVVNNADKDLAFQAIDLERQKVEAMGPERGELFMRQRYMDRLGVEYEPLMIEEDSDDHDDAGSDDVGGDMGAELPTPEAEADLDDDREPDEAEQTGAEPSADGKTGPESTEEIAEEELAEKTVESSPTVRPDGELSAADADEALSRETRKAELHEDISNSKTTADCVQARPDTHNGDLSTPYADGQDAPGTGDTDGDGIRDAAEDRDGDGIPDRLDRDAEYIDDDPDYEPVSMKERDVDELMSDKSEEAAFVASRSAAQAEKDVSLETVNR